MAKAGKGVVLPGGKLGVLPGGKGAVFNGDDECPTCCIELGDDCEHCEEGTTPVNMTIVHSGWSINCFCLLEDDFNNRYYTVTWAGDIDGEHLLAHLTADDCLWQKEVAISANAFVVKSYTDADCTENEITTNLGAGTLTYSLRRNATDWTLTVVFSETVPGAFIITLFEGSVADGEGDDCTEPSSPVSNQLACDAFQPDGVSPTDINISTLGSATIAAGDQT